METAQEAQASVARVRPAASGAGATVGREVASRPPNPLHRAAPTGEDPAREGEESRCPS